MLSRMAPSSPPVKRTLHLLKSPDILCANDSRQSVSYLAINNALSTPQSSPSSPIAKPLMRSLPFTADASFPEAAGPALQPGPPKYLAYTRKSRYRIRQHRHRATPEWTLHRLRLRAP